MHVASSCVDKQSQQLRWAIFPHCPWTKPAEKLKFIYGNKKKTCKCEFLTLQSSKFRVHFRRLETAPSRASSHFVFLIVLPCVFSAAAKVVHSSVISTAWFCVFRFNCRNYCNAKLRSANHCDSPKIGPGIIRIIGTIGNNWFFVPLRSEGCPFFCQAVFAEPWKEFDVLFLLNFIIILLLTMEHRVRNQGTVTFTSRPGLSTGILREQQCYIPGKCTTDIPAICVMNRNISTNFEFCTENQAKTWE